MTRTGFGFITRKGRLNEEDLGRTRVWFETTTETEKKRSVRVKVRLVV